MSSQRYDVPQTAPPNFRLAPDTIAAVRSLKRMLEEVQQPVPPWMQMVADGKDPNPSSNGHDQAEEPPGGVVEIDIVPQIVDVRGAATIHIREPRINPTG